MPRSVTDAPLTTRAARQRLAQRHQPYWRAIEAGAAIGYRKGTTGGVWVVRVADPTAGGGYRQATLGGADDALKADGARVLDWRQTEAAARDYIARHHRVAAGLEPEPTSIPTKPYSVADASTDYLADYIVRGGKAPQEVRYNLDAHILPALGKLPVGTLTRNKLKAWHQALAASPARLRGKKGQPKFRPATDDPDMPRRRRVTANHVLTALKAILNFARSEGKVTCPPDAWSAVKPFREVDAPKVRYLLDDEITRLAHACPADFRELVTGALLTGCRYGELAAMRAVDFDPQARTVTVGRAKSGKPRHVALTDEGAAFFDRLAAGKVGSARLFERDIVAHQATREAPAQTQRGAWRKSDQFRLMRDACNAANIAPAITFHILRHSYASRLARNGVPIAVIAQQLGHSDTRMTERHYAHLAPSYVAETVRAAFGPLGIVTDTNAVRLGSGPSALDGANGNGDVVQLARRSAGQ
jgi:integrase